MVQRYQSLQPALLRSIVHVVPVAANVYVLHNIDYDNWIPVPVS